MSTSYRTSKRISLPLLFLALPLLVGFDPPKEDIPPEAATGTESKVLVRAKKHMVVAANPHASAAGLEILRAGGSAVDAAIAIGLVLGLVEPQSSGIGGGAFLLYFDKRSKRITAFDGRETAPASATPGQFLKNNNKPRMFFSMVIGGLSVGVPGQLRMFEAAHKKGGRLPWSRLFGPAIRLAENGFKVSPRLHKLLTPMIFLAGMSPAKEYFYQTDGTPKPVGTILKNLPLAGVLRAVANGGADAFYLGTIAADIVSAVNSAPRNPGQMTLVDLANYRAKRRKPVCIGYRSYRVCGMPPPTSGGLTTLQILAQLERFDLSPAASKPSDFIHLFSESSRLAFADRARYIADPGFVKVPRLLDRRYIKRRSKLIDADKVSETVAAGSPPGSSAHFTDDASPELPSTSHWVVVDANGNAVSATASIESAFGSHLMVRGFLLNNELTDFSFLPTSDGRPIANRVEAGKRPRSSMAPIIVQHRRSKRLKMLIGSPGGSRIINYVARTLIEVLDREQDIQSAISAPNFVNQRGVTELERLADPAAHDTLTKSLTARGHTIAVRDLNSGLHGIVVEADGTLTGGADPRREGIPRGD
ncbi:MAG: gamma-glutamyltranspeptidase/glutathione hydrolase [Myxococcota bacterium]|jgi:gamma-glutamyltranspeptidase/glutathione hydrolase